MNIQDEGKSNEGRERGGGGGGGRRELEMEKYPHYSIDMKSTLPIEVISVDGGGVEFFEFCRYTWNFVRTNETTQGHHCIDKILVISNEMRRIVCFRRENTKLSAYLARSHSFHFFRVSGSSVSLL